MHDNIGPESPPRTPNGWRVALSWMPVQLVVLFVALAALDLVCQFLGGRLLHQVTAPLRDTARLLSALFLSVVMIAAYRSLVRVVERRRPAELATVMAARGLASGVVAGAALFGCVYAILWAVGAVAFKGYAGLSGIGAALAGATAAAVGEEIVFRGVVFRLLESRLGTTIAVVLSAGAFGLLHAGNPGATWVSTLAIALEAGALLGLAYAASRTLWLPIGLHFGWNFTEGGVFGAAVSGGQATGIIAASPSGPPWITGGAFGPEASVAAVLVSAGASAALVWYVIRQGAWRPRR